MVGSLLRERTVIVGLIGADIGPSLSPALHEREARRLGLDYRYERIDLTTLAIDAGRIGELIVTARRMGYRGLNVTHPCKRTALAHLTSLSDDAAALGAVNTIVFSGEEAVGHNTDWAGFKLSFERGLSDVCRDRVVLVGAGGAGAAVAHGALALDVGRLEVHDRAPGAAERLVASLRRRWGPDRAAVATGLGEACARAHGLIHATPTGMAAHPGMALDPGLLRPEMWVAEVVYRPLETELLRHARSIGCRTLNGGGMAVFQAGLSLELFTGRAPDYERMLRHFAEIVAGETGDGG